ncbi:hypothetical protein HMPREF9336_04343 [Segniliparus rugosus ATCC BAA-974]|uniref:Metal-dependent hydrolase n=1 Tax=Segniliparus rugosus (strain ATCC BAA-974 / DSM 45345 / CCUG 50838 / CIP 108380 / JCM 13579 / CDC 945) TaxID=679197 RepID=U1N4T0_SEGRC|nr:hypothetical protein HMPREF9336_04343 [Segniliparus rugosus ATCC BAA-974]
MPQPTSTRYPKVRRILFRFGDPEPMRRYFADNNIVYSHFVAGLSFGFPPGEEAFIRAVRRYSDHVVDPVLKKRVAGFIGQEAVHGQQHNSLNEKLIELGYRDQAAKSLERMRRLEERYLDKIRSASPCCATRRWREPLWPSTSRRSPLRGRSPPRKFRR